MIRDIFVIEAGSEWKPPEHGPGPEIGPEPRIQEIVPTETPQERERREREEAVIRGGLLEKLKRGEIPGRGKPQPPEVIYH